MSAEENKVISRRFTEEVFNKKNLDAIDELCAPNYVDHNSLPEVAPDREGLKQWAAMALGAFPDYHSTIEDMIAEGDKVVQRFTGRSTHKGEFMGIAPTGKQVTFTGIAIHRIAGGKILENWVNMEELGMMQQLGVVPPIGQARG